MAMRLVISVVVTMLVLGIIACVGGAGTAVNLSEFKFDPANVTIKQGEKVSLTLANKGTVVHDWAITDLGVRSAKLQPGATSTLEFTPDKSGTFKIQCTEPGHADSGMVGQLTVQ